MEKEFEKLRELEEELDAMKKLGADEEIIEEQLNKIYKQEKKIFKAFHKDIEDLKENLENV